MPRERRTRSIIREANVGDSHGDLRIGQLRLLGYARLDAFFYRHGLANVVNGTQAIVDAPLVPPTASNSRTGDDDHVLQTFLSCINNPSKTLCATHDNGPHVYVLMARAFYLLVSILINVTRGSPSPSGLYPNIASIEAEHLTMSSARDAWKALERPKLGRDGKIVSACILPRKPKTRDWNGVPRGDAQPTYSKRSGYTLVALGGRIGAGGQPVAVRIHAHRLICWFEWGPPASPLPANAVAMHRCHNSYCLNPYHIYWGENQKNLADARPAWRATARSLA